MTSFNPFTARVFDRVLWGNSNFWSCGRNPMMWPFKWKLSACTFTGYSLFVKILGNEIGNLVEICLWPHLAVKGLRKLIAVRLPLGCRRTSDKSPSQNYLMRYLTAYNIRTRGEVNPFPFLRDFVAGLPPLPPPCEVIQDILAFWISRCGLLDSVTRNSRVQHTDSEIWVALHWTILVWGSRTVKGQNFYHKQKRAFVSNKGYVHNGLKVTNCLHVDEYSFEYS